MCALTKRDETGSHSLLRKLNNQPMMPAFGTVIRYRPFRRPNALACFPFITYGLALSSLSESSNKRLPGCRRTLREEDHGGFRSTLVAFPSCVAVCPASGPCFSFYLDRHRCNYVERRISAAGSRGIYGRADARFYLVDPEALDFSVDLRPFPVQEVLVNPFLLAVRDYFADDCCFVWKDPYPP